jgi:4-amino-4-deoxy-L-arabinose transferase-like glycosyltransferase
VNTFSDDSMTRDVRVLPARSLWTDPWLWIIMAGGVALRLLYFHEPYADAHRWRQIENLAVAWNFYEHTLNPFYPEAIWGGLHNAYVEMEFPVVPFVLAMIWRLVGFHEVYGRVIGIVSSMVLIWAVYAVGRQLVDRGVGRAAALLLAISPTTVFFGRVPMTDTPMIACSTLAVLGYLRYFDTNERGWAVLGASAAAGAWLLKVPSVLILGPIAIIAWQARGWRLILDRYLVGGLLLALAATAAWYGHALRLYHLTGWTVGIWHPAGQHPADIAAMSGTPSSFSLWSTRELLMTGDFYTRLADRAWYIHFTPIGIAGILLGLMRALSLRRGFIIVTWFAASVAFVLVVGWGNFWHEYYQLPLMPPAALLFGIAMGPVFSGAASFVNAAASASSSSSHASARGLNWRLWLDRAARPVIIAVLALASFYYSGIIRNFFRPETQDTFSIESGKAIATHIPPTDGLIVVEYEAGTNSPVLLYFARRRGWSFDLATISPHVIEKLRKEGALYFATTIFPLLEEKRPDVVTYLKMHREIPLDRRVPNETKLFELD